MSKITDYDPKLEALKIILDARRHEIDLVWKRGLFFWGFVALAAAGTGHALTDGATHLYLAMVTSGLGAAASFASYLVARGSKRWQVIWELRAEIVEREVIGRLFHSTQDIDHLKEMRDGLVNETYNKKITDIIEPKEFSVSKLYTLLNLCLAIIFTLIFEIICVYWAGVDFQKNFDLIKAIAIGGANFLLIAFFCLAYCYCRSSPGSSDKMDLK